MVIGFPSPAATVAFFFALLVVAVVFGVAAVRRFRQKDRYGMWQGIFGALGFGLLPYSWALGSFQAIILLMFVAASVMGLRGHIG